MSSNCLCSIVIYSNAVSRGQRPAAHGPPPGDSAGSTPHFTQLRRELEASLRNRHELELHKRQQQKRAELSKQYEERIRQRVEASNCSIKDELASLVEMIEGFKNPQRSRARGLSGKEEEEFVEQTVAEILADENMVEEVRNRLRPKLEAKVKAALEKELEEGVEQAKRELSQRLREEREAWTEERIAFWRDQSARELEELAREHSELNAKKQSIESALSAKRGERQQLEQRLALIVQKNAMVANLRREVSDLKQKMRA